VAAVAGTVPARRAAPPAGATSGFVTAPTSCRPRPVTTSRGHRRTAKLQSLTFVPLFPRTPMTSSTGRDDFRCAHDTASSLSASHASNVIADRPPNAAADRSPECQPGAGAEHCHRTPASSLSCSTAGCATRTDRARHPTPRCCTQPALLPLST
jgi:hypothetical protein